MLSATVRTPFREICFKTCFRSTEPINRIEVSRHVSSTSSQAVAGVLLLFCVKFILGRSPKVNESIEDPFK
jgi:hypothetical protein